MSFSVDCFCFRTISSSDYAYATRITFEVGTGKAVGTRYYYVLYLQSVFLDPDRFLDLPLLYLLLFTICFTLF